MAEGPPASAPAAQGPAISEPPRPQRRQSMVLGGLFVLIGWVVGWRRNRDLALTCILMFAGEWLANGTFDRYFWGGMSFGGRRFVDLAVPFALGIAWFAERVGTWIAVAIVTPLVGWSVALMVAAQANTISLARYVTGSQLFAAVFSIETWRLTPLHTDRNAAVPLLQRSSRQQWG